MWNEQHWTLVSMPVTSTRAQWDEGLRTVRQFNDLLRVLPPIPQTGADAAAGQPARRVASPSRPLKPSAAARQEAARPEAPTTRGEAPSSRGAAPRPDGNRSDPAIRRPPPRNGRQSPHYQR
jgi:hypothetical protein